MTRRRASVVGLFPTLSPASIGGVQASGRLAWRTVLEAAPAGSDPWHVCWGRSWWPRAGDIGVHGPGAHSRLGAVATAVWHRWMVGTVLVWHLDLLRLVPAFRARGARIVVFLHGIEAWRRRDWLTRRLIRRVNLFLANSHHTWTRFVERNAEAAAVAHHVLPLGVAAPVPTVAATPATPPAALMLGRLLRAEDYKGHREMIAAWPLVLRRIPEAELWIAGDGDLRPELERLARSRGLHDRVHFWGHVSEALKEQLLCRARCLALPSRGEGFGLVYVEAMRVGRPCLVSTVDAGREVVNPPEAGLAADPSSPEQLADVASRLLTPGQEWDSWSANARRRYAHRFTADEFRRRLLAVLPEVVDMVPVG